MTNHRLENLRAAMQKNNIENMIVTNPFNMNYLAHFKGANGDGCVVITPKKYILNYWF